MTMRSKKSISSLFPYLILSVVVGSARTSSAHNDCSSTCGSQSISYPFRLQGDPANCGDPKYEFICDGNKTILELYNGTYYVNEMFYENATIRVVDANLASGQCKLPSLFPSRSVNLPYRIVGGDFTMEDGIYVSVEEPSWVSFANCSNKVQDDMYQAVPCLSGNDTFVYVINDNRIGALFPSCRFLSMIPTPDYYIYNIYGASSEADVFQTLKEGFFLRWESRFKTSQMLIDHCLKESIGIFGVYIFMDCLRINKGSLHIPLVPMTLALVCPVFFNAAAVLIVIAILVRFLLVPLSIFVFLAYECWKIMVPIDSIEKFLRTQQSLTPTRYAYADIIAMTRHFKEKLGQGGFGAVYRGELPGGNLVAIKMLGNSKCNGDEFINEVSTIGRIHHLNVVRLVGFCADGSNRALVYEFMPNGSLDRHIFSSNGNQRFTMAKLNEIALGVAKGIDYLHRGCDMTILHFDIKPHNILLDHNFNPKVSDFGLAKLYPKDYSMVSVSAARGTIGYIAPELVSRNFGVVSHKSDVYSFGMLLMEMAGGRRNVDHRVQNSSQVYYPSWIYDRLLQSEGPEICNSIEIDDMERKLCKIGLWCIQMRPSDRPPMSRVVEMLEADEQTLQMPPKPFLSTSGPVSVRLSCTGSSSSELSIISEED